MEKLVTSPQWKNCCSSAWIQKKSISEYQSIDSKPFTILSPPKVGITIFNKNDTSYLIQDLYNILYIILLQNFLNIYKKYNFNK